MAEEEKKCEDCGYLDGSFACKIRHVQFGYGNLKRERESSGPDFGLREER